MVVHPVVIRMTVSKGDRQLNAGTNNRRDWYASHSNHFIFGWAEGVFYEHINLCAALTWYKTQNPLDKSSVSEPETARSPVDEHIKLLDSCYIG